MLGTVLTMWGSVLLIVDPFGASWMAVVSLLLLLLPRTPSTCCGLSEGCPRSPSGLGRGPQQLVTLLLLLLDNAAVA